MSQQLTPINNGVQQVQTTTVKGRINLYSPQYVKVNNLQARPTEWNPLGRPIYRRLPAVSETYQIDFFNLVPAPNTAGVASVQDIGYVYVPWGESINGSTSSQVVASDNNKNLLIKSGNIVWKHGTNPTLPTIINLEALEVESGKYVVAYQLIYDDSPVFHRYSVENYNLSGFPLSITSSTDSVTGWRYPAENAFLAADQVFWSNHDTYFPNSSTYSVQPAECFLQWENTETQTPDQGGQVVSSAFSKVVLRCPPNTAYTASASLYYVIDGMDTLISTVSVSRDSAGQYYEFNLTPSFLSGWKVVWSETDMSIQSILVDGVIPKYTQPSGPTTRSVLVMYPENRLPEKVANSAGKSVPATYCSLAEVDVDSTYAILNVRDLRYIIHRDYVPVSDWLTMPFDKNLIDLYTQVKGYAELWMKPSGCMKQEYLELISDRVIVTT
jgi:hypothetical protein